jgi:anaerobic magnesium-protoporphyrin IX monomethyl ester cyclase
MHALIITPGGREKIYQELSGDYAAIEPPMWARLVAGYLLDQCKHIDILDTEALSISPSLCARKIEALKPKLIIYVSFGHQPSASTQSMLGCRDIANEVRRLKINIPSIIIGGHVSALPEKTLLQEPFDYVCIGEGPITCNQLLDYLEGKKDLVDVEGLAYLQRGKVIRNKPAQLIKDLDSELHGNVWHMLPMENYRSHNWQAFGNLNKRQPYASIYTSLGCPYKCVFCCINAPFDSNKYRCRSPEAVVAEIDLLYTKYGVATFKIVDEMFVLKKSHYIKICELLSEKPYAPDLNIWAYARIDTVHAETLELLRKAGIRWLALGIESADEGVRDGAEKSLSSQGVIEIVEKIKQADINVIGNYIFGLPHDNIETMQATLKLAKDLKCEFANFYSAMAYPGSQLYQLAIKNEWRLPEDWSGYSQHSYDCLPLQTEFLDAAQILAFRDNAFHEYFEDEHYLAFLYEKFGHETKQHIQQMVQTRLKRGILQHE